MATHMQTFTMIDIGKTAIVDKPIPIPGPNDALVRTTAALICTSDVHTVAGALPVENGRTLGHESVGVIEALGSDVNGFHVGQRVAVNAVTPCWTCSYCQGGYSSQCQGLLGGYKYTAQVDGNMAEYFLVPGAQANLALIPDELPDEAAVYACDMLSTGFTGAENAQIKIGDTVVIFAQGSVGLCATMGARLRGAGRIIAIEAIPERIELARRYGADDIIDYRQGSVVEQILELTGGQGADAAIEALGSPHTFEAALASIRAGGTLSNIGYHGENPEPLKLDLMAFGLGMGDKAIHTGLCRGGSDRMQRIFRLMVTGKIDPTPMTTHRFDFVEVQHAFGLMANKQDGIIKPLITFP
ncbi:MULTISPECIES: NAD(P)-dependent alcohol dehydrogenase [Rhodococcus]|jgi:isopropanol dehydrogenase (NADP+)|uniref:NAD(P)-dependent alcohol dehydrogenase n=1 Tax=Rhodococcus baikonurensis TaxID=172041 RepID=A0ABV5XFQ2_9NOCA|nr:MULTISPECIES: NAD(P)-dependent alcohol dehydrogenase [Rhodococcus]KLN73063.1 alcohol dehydrogenase [Rhodococcus erythropolis]KSU65025.1 alcohol dehydrogenase [Rhodococcus qingshengii]KZF17853.1 alcohol dehydrogenase [Rhodococcus sp. EPR-134]MDJ0441483.1 NAD(P)-dependent alcohol dehydrogenase [Rhodococcus qingshengii]SCC70205.1 Threonine dehydrogenase [Rhodococcus qingshengii]